MQALTIVSNRQCQYIQSPDACKQLYIVLLYKLLYHPHVKVMEKIWDKAFVIYFIHVIQSKES